MKAILILLTAATVGPAQPAVTELSINDNAGNVIRTWDIEDTDIFSDIALPADNNDNVLRRSKIIIKKLRDTSVDETSSEYAIPADTKDNILRRSKIIIKKLKNSDNELDSFATVKGYGKLNSFATVKGYGNNKTYGIWSKIKSWWYEYTHKS